MAMNVKNFGILSGRLSKDPKVFDNGDGSKKVYLTVACRNNYKSADGTTGAEFIDCEAFIPAGRELGVYGYMEKGTPVTLVYSQRKDTYTKDGETVYRQYNLIYNNQVSLDGSKPAVTTSADGTPEVIEFTEDVVVED